MCLCVHACVSTFGAYLERIKKAPFPSDVPSFSLQKGPQGPTGFFSPVRSFRTPVRSHQLLTQLFKLCSASWELPDTPWGVTFQEPRTLLLLALSEWLIPSRLTLSLPPQHVPWKGDTDEGDKTTVLPWVPFWGCWLMLTRGQDLMYVCKDFFQGHSNTEQRAGFSPNWGKLTEYSAL